MSIVPFDDKLTTNRQTKIITRSIALPVQECLSGEWKGFMRFLHGCWQHSTSLANWASHTLRRLDVVRTPGMKQLPKWEAVDLYALAFGRDRERPARKAGKPNLPVVVAEYDGGDFWHGAKVAAATLLRKVQSKYVRERGKIIWRRERRTPEFLYPYPFPVHQQAWTVFFNERNQPVLNMALPGGRVSLRLRQGDEFRHALRVLHGIAEGNIKQQELMITRQPSNAHSRLDSQRLPGGGHRQSYRVMVKISYQREVGECGNDAIATLRTGSSPFLTMLIGDAPPFVLHAEQARNWIVEHGLFLQRFSEDLKYEKRWPAHKRRSLNRYRERRCEKHHRRMKSFLQMTAAQFVGHAARRKVGRIEYDDEDRAFVSKFPWHELRSCLQNKCDEQGIVFAASGSVVEDGDNEPPGENGEQQAS